MLGSAVRQVFSTASGWRIDGTQSEDSSSAGYMDILRMPREEWTAILSRERYDYIANCVGLLKPAV